MIKKTVIVNIAHELTITNNMTHEELDLHLRKLLRSESTAYPAFWDSENGIYYDDSYPTEIVISTSIIL